MDVFYYSDEQGIDIVHADCRSALPAFYPPGDWGAGECVIVDPPWDQPEWFQWVAQTVSSDYESLLAFTDAKHIAAPIAAFGPPDWLFVWDTMNTWSLTKAQPVQQTKLCLWYGEQYDRDGELWGEPPPRRDHPTTKQEPLNGRRLTDLYRESLRWLHNPRAGTSGAGTERFGARTDGDTFRHAKPVGWLRCLIGNTSTGAVVDPFMGSGASAEAARDLKRPYLGIDIDEACCRVAVSRLDQGVLDFEA